MSATDHPVGNSPLFRIGLIGAGNVVETYHLPVLKGMKKGISVAWCYDKDYQRARELARRGGAGEAVRSLESCPDVDAVLVAVPVGVRRQVMTSVFARGWHALCEKPFALSVSDHEWMIEQAAKQNLKLAAGLLRRFCAGTRQAADLITSGALGEVERILAGDGNRLRRTGRGGDWYQSRPGEAGGVFFETGSHLVDQVMTIVGATGFEIHACQQVESQGLEMETSVRGVMLVSGRAVPFAFVVSRLRDPYLGIALRCKNGELRLGLNPDSACELWTRAGERIGSLALPRLPASIGEAVQEEWTQFLRSVRQDRDLAADTGLLLTEFIADTYARAGSPQPAAAT